jgi:hypothetical protein
MVKNFLLTIFISILTIGCDNQITGPIDWEDYYEEDSSCETEYFLELDSYLPKDENGYYVMEYIGNDDVGYPLQTFTTLTAKTGSEDITQLISWYTDGGIWVGISENTDSLAYWQFALNGSGYTDELGEAHTVLSAWQPFIGETIKIWTKFTDECNNIFSSDTLKVRVVDEN